MSDNIEVKHDIKQNHNVVVHTITHKYPLNNVVAMNKSWRETAQQCSEWLESEPENTKKIIEDGMNKIDEDVLTAKKELEDGLSMSDEELFEKYKKEHIDYLEKIKEFVSDEAVEERKKQLEQEILKQINSMKSDMVKKGKQMSDALKLWSGVKIEEK